MPRIIDFTSAPLTDANLRAAFTRLLAELSYATGFAVGSSDFPWFVTPSAHLGADLSAAIDRTDALINAAAAAALKAVPANGLRVYDFTTGTHDVARLHASLDRMHGRIAALSARSVGSTILPSAPYVFARTGSKTYINTAGTLSTATDGQAAIGLPYVVRRNLIGPSEDFTHANWIKTNASILVGQVSGARGHNMAKLVEAVGSAGHSLRVVGTTVSGSVYTYAIDVKAAERTQVFIECTSGATDQYAYVNLLTGAKISGTANPTITPLGDGIYRIAVTFTAAAATATCYAFPAASGSFTTTGDGASGIYVDAAMLNEGATALAYQATNSSGVDLANPLNGAGLVLEGSGTNLLSANQSDVETDTTAFTVHSNAIPTLLTRDTGERYQGSASLKTVTAGNGGSEGFSVLVSASTAGYYSAQVQVKGSGGAAIKAFLRFTYTDASTSDGTDVVFYLNGSWQLVKVEGRQSNAAPHSAKTLQSVSLHVRTNTATAATYYSDALQIEASPFATSWVQGGTTRNADLCGIVPPQQYLLSSEAFNNAAWAAEGTGAAQPTAAGVYTISNLDNRLYQAITPNVSPSSTAWTFAVSLKLGTLNGNVQIRLEDQAGATIGSALTVNTTDLSATDARTYYVTATPGASVTGLRAKIKGGSSGTGTIVLVSARLVQGSHPGVYVRTTDTAIPAPASVALDPAWSQNGMVKVRIKTPADANPNLALVGLFGEVNPASATVKIRFFRPSSAATASNAVSFDRQSNHTQTVSGGVGRCLLNGVAAIWDGAPHEVWLVWRNYTLNGVRYMPMELWVDGVLVASQDVAALYGATAWATIDAGKLVSDGNVQATLTAPSDGQMLSYPVLPAGAIAA